MKCNKWQWSNSPVVKALDSQSRVPSSKPLGGSKNNPAFHPSKVDQMSSRNFWDLVVKCYQVKLSNVISYLE